VGYYAQNYSQTIPDERERNVYVGIGLNLSRVFSDLSYRKTARVFNYLQLPGTYADLDKDLNE
jgi:hypothetical protein